MISIVIPVFNEEENIQPLIEELVAVAAHTPISEIIYIDDASTDKTASILKEMQKTVPALRVVRHPIRAGQSAAFMSGVRAAGNSVVVLMDGDRQNDPQDIIQLYEEYQQSSKSYPKVMVVGRRHKRQDTMMRKLSSRWANGIRSWFLKDHISDTGCSLKLIRREDYLRLPYFNHMHRFLPALLIRDYVHVVEVDVSHRARVAGKSKYGFWNRVWVGIVDLIGVKWLLNRGLPKGFTTQEQL